MKVSAGNMEPKPPFLDELPDKIQNAQLHVFEFQLNNEFLVCVCPKHLLLRFSTSVSQISHGIYTKRFIYCLSKISSVYWYSMLFAKSDNLVF